MTNGTLTQEQEDAIDSAFEEAMKSYRASAEKTSTDTQADPLSSLVSAGTITQDQEDAIKSAFESAMNFRRF